MRVQVSVVALFVVALSQAAHGGPASDLVSRAELRGVKFEARDFSSLMFGLKFAAPPVTIYDISVGAAYTHGEDGTNAWTTPLELDITLPDKVNVFKIKTDGYIHSVNQGETVSGLASLGFAASHAFKTSDGKSALRLGAGISVPTGGQVGGNTGAQSLSATVIRALNDKWTGVVALSESRRNAISTPGVSRYSSTGLGMIRYMVDGDHQWAFSVDRSVRRGAGGASEVSAEYDFPLTKILGGVLTLTRGLTSGSRDNTIEFDVTYSF
jgi:hypothetical protein